MHLPSGTRLGRGAGADSPDDQSAFRGETDGSRDIRGCRNLARIRCARGLLHPSASRNACGSYGRLEIRVVPGRLPICQTHRTPVAYIKVKLLF